ncbi:MAG: helix-turn-helix domain-containing protein [Anaerolineae bacterium]
MGKRKVKYQWDAESIAALRKHLGLTQQQMSEELGTRQQTISEWETGMYRPRGGMNRLLTLVAERAGFEYQAVTGASVPEEKEEGKGESEP